MQLTNWGIGFRNKITPGYINMELSPKQQAVNEIKNAKRILVLGHKGPDGDQLGSLLALRFALQKLDKNVEIVVTENISKTYLFLPQIKEIKNSYLHTEGKIIKIDTNKIPISGMKWQKEDEFLNIYLETDKNLKFEFIEIENGLPKPDLIIIVDTPDTKKIDAIYDKNTALFFEVPILNIDHHPGNEYFGTINLIDLTATSTTEILVSLFEALGIKIDNPEIATCLLSGILYETQSFRGGNTTPKSLTVAAQLLAAGGRQQEIVANFYKTEPSELLKVWDEMLKNLKEDKGQKLVWTKIDGQKNHTATKDEVFEAASDLLDNTPEAKTAIVLYKKQGDTIFGKINTRAGEDALKIGRLFNGKGTGRSAIFEISSPTLEDAENIMLKRIAENIDSSDPVMKKEVWDIMGANSENSVPLIQTGAPTQNDAPNSRKEKDDAIEEALKSISQAEQDENRKEFESLRDVIDRKKQVAPDFDNDIFSEE